MKILFMVTFIVLAGGLFCSCSHRKTLPQENNVEDMATQEAQVNLDLGLPLTCIDDESDSLNLAESEALQMEELAVVTLLLTGAAAVFGLPSVASVSQLGGRAFGRAVSLYSKNTNAQKVRMTAQKKMPNMPEPASAQDRYAKDEKTRLMKRGYQCTSQKSQNFCYKYQSFTESSPNDPDGQFEIIPSATLGRNTKKIYWEYFDKTQNLQSYINELKLDSLPVQLLVPKRLIKEDETTPDTIEIEVFSIAERPDFFLLKISKK